MQQLSKSDKQRVKDFIEKNNIDYIIVDNDISKFHIVAHDKIVFYFYLYNDEYLIVKYDKSKDKPNNPSSMAYTYFTFKTLSLALEQIKFYDDGLNKIYWSPVLNSAEIGFDSNDYIEDWYLDFIRGAEYMRLEDSDMYKYLSYHNPAYKPILQSPFYTLHEVSPLNSISDSYIKVNKLYFEIHPISCAKNNEKYLFKVLANNEEVLKEFINYIAFGKRGLMNLINYILNSCKK